MPAFTSAFCSTRKRQISRWPCDDLCRAVNPLNKEVHETLEGKVMTPESLIARIKGVAAHVMLRIYVGSMLDKKFANKEVAFTRRIV